MQWLLRSVGWIGHIRDAIIRLVVRLSLFLIYILGVGAMALGLRMRAITGHRPATTGFVPRDQRDSTPDSVE